VASLFGLEAEVYAVRAVDDPRFSRTMELVNKTNQFNTTGRRWTAAEFENSLPAVECV